MEWFFELIGGNHPAPEMASWQMALRTLLVYIVGLSIIRLTSQRVLGRSTAFDIILGFVLGSVISRGINGSASLLNTLVATVVLVSTHWIFAAFAFRFDWFGNRIKGRAIQVVRDGKLIWENMSKEQLSEKDVFEEMRLNGNLETLAEVKNAYLERSGDISITRQKPTPVIVEVPVENGVKVVRIEIS